MHRKGAGAGIINHKWWFSKILKEQYWWEIFIQEILLLWFISSFRLLIVNILIICPGVRFFREKVHGCFLYIIEGRNFSGDVHGVVRAAMGRVRLSITLLPISRYTLWLKCCCVFWTWVSFLSYHCVQIEVRQEILDKAWRVEGSYSLDPMKLENSVKWIDSFYDSQNAWINLKNWIIAVYSLVPWFEKMKTWKVKIWKHIFIS